MSYGKRAKEAITKALELNPKSSDVLLAEGVGNYYLPAMLGGGPELAAKNFNEAITLDPKSADAYLWLGLTLRKLHKNPEGAAGLRQIHGIESKQDLGKGPTGKDAGAVKTGAGVAAAIFGLTLLTYFQFPGHTYLQQDTQIYVPILEHLWDSSVLSQDLLVQRPHVAFTLYDELALLLRWCTGIGFHAILAALQIITRGLGLWGIYLIALKMLGGEAHALLVTAVCGLGAAIDGPAVLVIEYEPSPRAFAIPLVFLAIGLMAWRKPMWAGTVAAIGFVLHPSLRVGILDRSTFAWNGAPKSGFLSR